MHRYPLAVASGLALWLAFPSHNLWIMAPVGVAMLALATRRAPPWQGALLGLVSGLACFVPLLSWSGVYVGVLPWIALAVLESLYFALLGLASALLQGGAAAGGTGTVRPLVVALIWVAQEALRGSTPFGGFPWGRLAFSQADSPLAGLAAIGGAPAVTFAVALAGALLAAGVARLDALPALEARGVRIAILCLACAIAVVLLPALIPRPIDGPTGRFLAVQGNVPRPGLNFNAERRAVLDKHARATLQAADAVKAGTRPKPDLVVWPENASDIDPFRNPDAAAQIDNARRAVGVPLLIGAVLDEPPGHGSNVSLFYLPGVAEPQRYVKLHPVPFAEYIPSRRFFRIFTPMADLAGNFIAGDEIGVFTVPTAGGDYAALPTICFEVAYDQLMRNSVEAAGEVPSLLVVQTNTATFGYTAESEQQFAISRIRAIEHGRSVVHVSTVGVSGFVAPDGSVTEKTALFTADQRVAAPVVRTERTPADRLGAAPEWVAALVLLLLVVGSTAAARSVRVSEPRSPDPTPPSTRGPIR